MVISAHRESEVHITSSTRSHQPWTNNTLTSSFGITVVGRYHGGSSGVQAGRSSGLTIHLTKPSVPNYHTAVPILWAIIPTEVCLLAIVCSIHSCMYFSSFSRVHFEQLHTDSLVSDCSHRWSWVQSCLQASLLSCPLSALSYLGWWDGPLLKTSSSALWRCPSCLNQCPSFLHCQSPPSNFPLVLLFLALDNACCANLLAVLVSLQISYIPLRSFFSSSSIAILVMISVFNISLRTLLMIGWLSNPVKIISCCNWRPFLQYHNWSLEERWRPWLQTLWIPWKTNQIAWHTNFRCSTSITSLCEPYKSSLCWTSNKTSWSQSSTIPWSCPLLRCQVAPFCL